MGNLQNNIKGQITRSLSNESHHQATDNVSSRQTAPAEQSQQSFTRHTFRGHDPRMDQTAFEVDQSLGSEADFDEAHSDYESLDV